MSVYACMREIASFDVASVVCSVLQFFFSSSNMMLLCDSLYFWKKRMKIVCTSTFLYLLIVLSSFSHGITTCKIEYQSQLFDFNGLALKPWIVSDISDPSLSNISFSICNTTHQSPCGMVGFCVVMEDNSKWFSLSSNLLVQENKGSEDIRLSTVLNKMGSDRSIELNLELRFKCGVQIGEPKVEESKPRQLVLKWETLAACKLQNLVPYKNCIFEDDLMGKFNIQSLRHLLYYSTTNNKGSKFFINVCGGTVGTSVCGNVDDVAACKIDSKNTTILGYASRQIISEKHLYLEYRIKKKIVKIELICNSKMLLSELKLKSETNSSVIFYLETPLACVNKLTKCSVEDKNHFSYNLSSLSTKDYEIYDENKHKYIVSVCRSVKDSDCLGGVSICLQTSNSTINLGTLKEGPRYKDEDDQLSITSSGGAYCNINNFRYTSVMIFKCAKTDSLLSLVNISEDCIYTFVWQTKFACPYLFEEGKNCIVRDEEYGYTFDFNSLRKTKEDYVIKSINGGHFRLNICGDLVIPCNGSTNVGVCLIDRSGTEHAIGEVAKSPLYNNGRLSFELNGELCKSNQMAMKVNIKFKCSHQANAETSFPEFVEKLDNCTYVFVWYTDIACPDFIRNIYECKVADDSGEVYDLSPLSLHSDDYFVWHNTTNQHWKFVINVCQPIMFGNRARCSSGAAICMQNMSEPNYLKSFRSLGYSSTLQFDKIKKVLKIDYSDGSTCHDGRKEGNNIPLSSTIYFICDRASSSYPKLTGQNYCHYEFEWRTKLACPKQMESNNEGGNCKTYDPISGVRVDLSSFVGHEYKLNHSSGGIFRFVVCGSLNNASTSGVGICQETENDCENMGMGNSDLHYNAGKLFLNYTDGANCATNAKTYSLIEFICDTKDRELQTVTSLSPCAYSVSWFTSLACMVPCMTDGPKQINLSFLSSNKNNFKTTENGVDYFINVCKPLVPTEELNCDFGSAVCKAVPRGKSRWTEGMSLGFPHFRPVLHGNNVILNYSSNQQCPNDTLQKVGSSIVFICDPLLGIGVPVLNQLLQSGCHYEFFWKTSVICNDNIIELSDAVSEKMLNNSQSNMYIDLRPFCIVEKYEVGNFVISMCGQHHLCEIQKINTQRNISYGRAEYAVFNYSQNQTKLIMINGDECEAHFSKKYNASIDLLCTTDAVDDLHILKETDCSVEFVWKSRSACGHRSLAATISTTVMVSKSSAGTTIGVVLGLILAVIVCLIIYCLKKSRYSNCFRRNMNRLLSRRHEGEFHYTLRNPDSYDFEMSSEELL